MGGDIWHTPVLAPSDNTVDTPVTERERERERETDRERERDTHRHRHGHRHRNRHKRYEIARWTHL